MRAILSVLDQTCTEFEVIVVVDGPDAATETAVKAIRDRRLRCVVLDLSLIHIYSAATLKTRADGIGVFSCRNGCSMNRHESVATTRAVMPSAMSRAWGGMLREGSASAATTITGQCHR